MLHNWLYSVVPKFPVREVGSITEQTGIYLVGYCRQCRQAFTVRLLDSSSYSDLILTDLNIPTDCPGLPPNLPYNSLERPTEAN